MVAEPSREDAPVSDPKEGGQPSDGAETGAESPESQPESKPLTHEDFDRMWDEKESQIEGKWKSVAQRDTGVYQAEIAGLKKRLVGNEEQVETSSMDDKERAAYDKGKARYQADDVSKPEPAAPSANGKVDTSEFDGEAKGLWARAVKQNGGVEPTAADVQEAGGTWDKLYDLIETRQAAKSLAGSASSAPVKGSEPASEPDKPKRMAASYPADATGAGPSRPEAKSYNDATAKYLESLNGGDAAATGHWGAEIARLRDA